MKNSDSSAIGLVEKNDTPVSISDLAIGGAEIIALGISGRAIGKTLALLLDEVMRDPSLNTKERLLELARQIKLT